MKGLEEQLIHILSDAARNRDNQRPILSGNIIIEGEHKTGKTMLAVDLMRTLNRMRGQKGKKVAKISGDRLNNKEISETIEKLADSDLLVERAGEMHDRTAQELLRAVSSAANMLVVLEDTRGGMEDLTARNANIQERFTYRILLEECAISEWVEAAKQYADTQDYRIDDMATLALSAKIDNLLAERSRISIEDVKAIMDAAIEKSEKKNLKKLLDIVFTRKYKESDLTVLRESDFL
jgi:hypothetical protein